MPCTKHLLVWGEEQDGKEEYDLVECWRYQAGGREGEEEVGREVQQCLGDQL